MSGSKKCVGVVGSSGYGGIELLRLLAGHPELDVVAAQAGTQAGTAVASLTPSLAAAYGSLEHTPTDAAALVGLDVVFLALPHGESQHLVPSLVDRVGVIVDLAADFRLSDPMLYPRWYGHDHSAPDLLATFVYGLPELHRADISGSRRIAAAGCYPTAALLALAPLAQAGLLSGPGLAEPGPAVVVDAASGVSGAGRAAKPSLQFSAVDEDFVAYGLLDHRHTAELEQGLATDVLFTPHLAPMVRGILATCYARPAVSGLTTETALDVLRQYYRNEPFVVVVDEPPSTKATCGANTAHVSVRVDPRTGWIVALGAIDNLVKGAAGQAIQCANVALGLPEGAGLPTVGVYP